ncbi:hypothetical protein C8J57DRAFT_1607077 [Mycena rebaudengoi]|nr:hypothetical protein C8J57DRAFT_1607077 [Mycena rebaudengoi]
MHFARLDDLSAGAKCIPAFALIRSLDMETMCSGHEICSLDRLQHLPALHDIMQVRFIASGYPHSRSCSLQCFVLAKVGHSAYVRSCLPQRPQGARSHFNAAGCLSTPQRLYVLVIANICVEGGSFVLYRLRVPFLFQPLICACGGSPLDVLSLVTTRLCARPCSSFCARSFPLQCPHALFPCCRHSARPRTVHCSLDFSSFFSPHLGALVHVTARRALVSLLASRCMRLFAIPYVTAVTATAPNVLHVFAAPPCYRSRFSSCVRSAWRPCAARPHYSYLRPLPIVRCLAAYANRSRFNHCSHRARPLASISGMRWQRTNDPSSTITRTIPSQSQSSSFAAPLPAPPPVPLLGNARSESRLSALGIPVKGDNTHIKYSSH